MARLNETTKPSDRATPQTSSHKGVLEERVVAFAEQVGQIVGIVQAKADGWFDRQTLNEQLTRIRDGAADLLNQLGSAAASASVAANTARQQARAKTAGRSATTITTPGATAAIGRSGGKVDAPGKTHRKPPPSQRGVKKSDEMIPKAKAAQQMRQRRRG